MIEITAVDFSTADNLNPTIYLFSCFEQCSAVTENVNFVIRYSDMQPLKKFMYIVDFHIKIKPE